MLLLDFDFSSWWSGMETLEQIYWMFAIPASLGFIIIAITTFLGGEVDAELGDADMEVDTDDGIGFQFITVKNMIGFFTIFSWTGIACLDSGYSAPLTITVSVIAGLAMMFTMAGIFYWLTKLTDSGTLKMENAIGGVGEVYLLIGKNRSGLGKVTITIQGAVRELQAMTDDGEDLSMGTIIEVKEVINNQILLVTKSKK